MTINNLLPGTFDTDRLRATMTATRAKAQGKRRRKSLTAARAGESRRGASARRTSSAPCARSCAARTRALVGQNVLIDGGAYPGTF